MATFLIRHAKAGRRAEWTGDDRYRPLSQAGWRQAAALADRLAPERPVALYSSPYARCVQTLEPLADRLGIPVTSDRRLAEETPLPYAMELLREAGDGAVLCSHGDVVPDLIGGLARRGTKLRGEPDWRKGSLWVLEWRDGEVVKATPEPPPLLV